MVSVKCPHCNRTTVPEFAKIGHGQGAKAWACDKCHSVLGITSD